jgi:hypothetical protein
VLVEKTGYSTLAESTVCAGFQKKVVINTAATWKILRISAKKTPIRYVVWWYPDIFVRKVVSLSIDRNIWGQAWGDAKSLANARKVTAVWNLTVTAAKSEPWGGKGGPHGSIKPIDSVWDHGCKYTEEYIAGGNLENNCGRRGRDMGWREAVRIFVQIYKFLDGLVAIMRGKVTKSGVGVVVERTLDKVGVVRSDAKLGQIERFNTVVATRYFVQREVKKPNRGLWNNGVSPPAASR